MYPFGFGSDFDILLESEKNIILNDFNQTDISFNLHKDMVDLFEEKTKEFPNAVAVIDPKIPTTKYPFEHLAGCGVAAKLIWALRFSKTKFYESSVILLHALPGPGENTTTIIEAVQLDNLVETGRVIEEVPNGVMDLEHSRVVSFLSRQIPILVLDKDIELRALR